MSFDNCVYANFNFEFNKVIKKVNIIASDTVSKLTLVNMTTTLYNTWFNLLR